MKFTIGTTAHEAILDTRSYFQNRANEAPLRAELFSTEQLEHYGQKLATTHELSDRRVPGLLLKRLAENERLLNDARTILVDAIRKDQIVTPAGEWLIDNFYLIEEQIRTVKKHLPRVYSERLPQLRSAQPPGVTRVYNIILQIVTHSDGRIDWERLSKFITSYQSVTQLELGELWAVPIMLRLTLIENLRRVSTQVAIDMIDRNLADYWSKQMLEVAQTTPQRLVLNTADMARSNPPMTSAFVSEMSRQLLGKGTALSMPLTWMEQRLAEDGRTSSELVAVEIQQQAANQVSVSNSIGSLRLLGSLDWRAFVEGHSVVEQTLRTDVNGVYGKMDFATRDHYRHMVEYIAKKSLLSENEVARIAIKLAHDASDTADSRESHVGYYLIDKGVSATEKEAKMHHGFVDRLRKSLSKSRMTAYLGGIVLMSAVTTAGFIWKAHTDDINNPWLLVLLGACLILASSQLAVTVINFFSTLLVKPHLLPRMDFSEAIPEDCSSLIVIPTMLSSVKMIEEMVEALEVRFLANRDENLRFSLLTDFKDAPQKTLPEDARLLELVKCGIENLKKKYEDGTRELFFLFHRPRQWNAREKIWMGYERKRGKLSELNCLLRGACKESFSCIVGDVDALREIRYVVTLDSDTQLPRGTAWKMIASMAHPLNRPVYDEKKRRVTEGYGILQPRIDVSLPEAGSSYYSRLHGNEPGIDPYTRASSDVYQDLFAEGSFIGKGIYDVDVFEKVLHGKFPENRILSHDLLEGSYVRSGLLSDVELYEKYPMSYRLDMKRRVRWVRGDWQIFPWFLPFIPGGDKRWHKNTLSALSRWKIFDNIRRSLIPFALTALMILGWTILDAPLFWTIAVSAIIVFPIFVTVVWDAFQKPDDVILSHHIKMLGHNTANIVVHTVFSVICLPYEGFANMSAILRTVWRVLISHRKLLEWDVSSNIDNTKLNSLQSAYKRMWIAPFLAVALLAFLVYYDLNSFAIAVPILLLWGVSPFIIWYSSRPVIRKKALFSSKQHIFLHKISRKTWAFFEKFVTVDENWLPPDNFQEYPQPVIAHRTSPTNIGLSLLANITAWDFGYLSMTQVLNRTSDTIDTLHKLERFRGHFYNWYDTQTLQPLLPKYISTVDSGNLAGHLLTLRQSLFEILHGPMVRRKIFEGLLDTLRVLKDNLGKEELKLLAEFSSLLDASIQAAPATIDGVQAAITQLSVSYQTAKKELNAAPESMAEWWAEMLAQQISDAADDVQLLEPWIDWPPYAHKFIDTIGLNGNISLSALCLKVNQLVAGIDALKNSDNTEEENQWLDVFKQAITALAPRIKSKESLIEKLGHECIGLADMEWDFLYDRSKHLFTIGYKVEEHVCDPSFYDLLASEARLCTFVAIAQGKLPEESWFALGRLLTNAGGAGVLLSWSGSMFEYLMPLLVMPTYENTLLDQTYKGTVKRQIEYGKQRGVPWGISESGYNMVDAASNYQYRAFGVPGLGLKRGLEADLVIAPYATAMALMVDPEGACQNLETMWDDGFEGAYGFHEAIDYTPSRLQLGQTKAVIQSFMAHHQGMSFLSLGYLLHEQPMQRRFEAEPQFQATVLLLQERIPKSTSFYAHTTDMAEVSYPVSGKEVRVLHTPDTPIPEVQLLSNGKYHVMVTNSGGGYSRWKDLAVTRWREDTTCDNWGMFCYIRDLGTGAFWSNTYQPVQKKAKMYEAAFSQGRVDFHNSTNDIETHTEIVISPEDDIEMRRIHITNRAGTRKTIEITSYAEVVLAAPASDLMQPAFGNLFVQTEIVPDKNAIICTRRPRSADEHVPWMFHTMMVNGTNQTEVSYETDRMAFLGHGNTPANPVAMSEQGPLAGGQGSVLDPIVAVRHKVVLGPDESVSFDLVTGVAETREVCEHLITQYQDRHHKDRVLELSWTHSQVILRQINASEADAQLFGRLASSVIFMNASLRADPSILIKNHKGQSGLWGYSISGDLPIVLLQIEDQNNIQLARQLIQAHTYWHLKGLIVDLVIWNEDHGGYRQAFQNQILSMIPNEFVNKPGGIFLRAADQISNEDRILFQTVARVIISDANGSLADQVAKRIGIRANIPYLAQGQTAISPSDGLSLPKDLLFDNGLGGFSADGKEYVIIVDNKKRTPTPWVNVIANPDFGTVVSESGQAYTWIDNAHEMRLTPWNNDIVSDTAGEVFYLRDEESGNFWSATPLPRAGDSAYVTRHGFGYSVFEHMENGIYSEMTVFTDVKSPVKFTIVKIRNNSGQPRKLSVTGYTEWVLGDLRPKTAMYVITELEQGTGALISRNPYSTEFGERVAFFDVGNMPRTYTGDRTEFIGRNKSLQNPDAMHRTRLSNKVGVGFDPCAAIMVPIELANGEEREIVFRLGAGQDMNQANDIIRQFRGNDIAHEAYERARAYWQHTTSAVQIETPDTATNILTNGWLNYQTLSCRLWGRSGYYQSGGAFGFRDQLQDVVSLLFTTPELARKQLVLAASRQFPEGDVQHWWHPPVGRGVRTRISDDYLWLPLVTCKYIQHTGDLSVLDESQPFLDMRPLSPGEDSVYALPGVSDKIATLYEHCVCAIRHGLNFGAHGLPLMGTGDWNDGMDRVGREGKGESVWLAFFLYDVLVSFIDIANRHNDAEFAAECRKQADTLSANIDKNAWDGNWYRRAYFDDGTPLGSSQNEECQIDSISQSWSVLSGAGNPERALMAMTSAEQHLVKTDAGLIQLLEPPFDKSNIDPGYIKGYVPGVRENGGQYTHAAVWLIMAFAKLKNTQKTWSLLQMINPLNHGRTAEQISIYKVEPYVLAADVYGCPPHTGRGGWTWYTGSASWMYQLIVSSFLGLQVNEGKLSFNPCVPEDWKGFKLHYRYKETTYHITILQKSVKEMTVLVDNDPQQDKMITLIDDKKEHEVIVVI
ncbi:GH36-type glycosyl hydrolase domain-containing protein [Taibaiella soli]|uniref:Cyclic beta 1-2 glucan synthetase n=1 Tax=Taibaiella soli TaxID=1649169 RepID=A0A2W2BXV3_9BACT|nr:glucoamylase family protein [Taibaiella soli]PZF72683.1 cyclic beta 1-2 glucan synthetase [Taibaiella soli]